MLQTPLVDFTAELRGEVNGQPIHVHGEGAIVKGLGVTAGTYFLKQLPDRFDPKLLAGCLVTGYPSACADLPAARNPFDQSPYEYHRSLVSSDDGRLDLSAKCTYQDGRLISRFVLNGKSVLPNVSSLFPITETWRRAAPNKINAHFRMDWTMDDARHVRIDVTSIYRIEDPLYIPPRLTRTIDVYPKALDDRILSLFQVSSLASDEHS